MEDYAKPLMGFGQDLVVLHTGTNPLRGENTPKKIAEDIITLSTELKSDTNKIMISSIVPRRDQLREEAEEVNDFLYNKAIELGFSFISHENISTDIHLKPKGLHLNQKGCILLADNLIKWINT